MPATRPYSTLFTCLHDEPAPVGQIGRGAHYSVFRAVAWRDDCLQPLDRPQLHDFGLIWDEDHDERVIDAVERIYMEGLLSPVQFIGERKGSLTILVTARFRLSPDIQAYAKAIQRICSALDDPWSLSIGFIDRTPGSPCPISSEYIIQTDEQRSGIYLRNIDALWNLGSRPFVPATSRMAPAGASGDLDF